MCDSMTPSSRIILHLPFLSLISSGLSPVRLPLRRDAGLLLPLWPFQLLQQPLVCSALELVHWLHSLRQGPMTTSTYFSWLIWESFQLAVLHHWLLHLYLYLLLLCHPFLVHINLCRSSTCRWIAGWTSCWFMRLWRHCCSLVNHRGAC